MKNRKFKFISISKLRTLCVILIVFFIITLGVCFYLITINNSHKQTLITPNSHKTPNKIQTVEKVDKKPKLALIIDDFGQSRTGVKDMLNLKIPLTIAVMPFLSYSKADAENAHRKGFEVIVHLPMQSQINDKISWLGPMPIEVNQDDDEIDRIVIKSFNDIPFALGANIHMGSMSSEDDRVMSCVMNLLKQKHYFFIDSRTTSKTVCDKVAKEVGVKYGKRNVFLDDGTKNIDYIKGQLSSAADLAIKNGFAIAIGHVGSMGGVETAESINEMIPELKARGIEFVFVSQLVK